MLTKPLIAFANCYNFNVLDDYAYGKIGKYLVSVTSDGYKKVAFIAFFAFEEEEEGEQLLKYKLSEEIKNAGLPAFKDYEVLEDGLLITTGEELKSFDEAVIKACEIAEKLGFKGSESCTYCGADMTRGEEYVCLDGHKSLLLCRDCAEDFLNEYGKKEKAEKSKGKKRGAVAAALAALAGLLIFACLYVFALPYDGISGSDGEVIVRTIQFNMPFAAVLTVLTFLAYRVFTGRKGPERLIPCGVSSLLATVLLSYFASAVQYAKMFAISFANSLKVLGNILKAPFADPYFRTDFLRYLLYSVLACVVVCLVYSIVFDEKKKQQAFVVRYGETEKLTSLSASEDSESGKTEAADIVPNDGEN